MDFFHVTLLDRLPKILKKGIIPNQPQIWRQRNGNTFRKGEIYVFDTYLDAVRWAFKLSFELNKNDDPEPYPVIIIGIADDVCHWVEDDHVERVLSGHKGRWWKRVRPVDVEKIASIDFPKEWKRSLSQIVR